MSPRRRGTRSLAVFAAMLPLALVASTATPSAGAAPSPSLSAHGDRDTHKNSKRDKRDKHDKRDRQNQPPISARAKETITVDGRQFKDSNGNGELDAYEDWRLPSADRAADLAARMTLNEKAGLMLIDTLNAECGGEVRTKTAATATMPANDNLTDDYLNTQQMRRFVFRNVVATSPDCTAATPTVSAQQAAEYTNAVQELAEKTRLGIPVLFKSNARNHIDPDPRTGINVGVDKMTAFPKEAGIAAAAFGEQARKTGKATTGDMSVVRAFADVMGQEWAAIGLRGMYGYMADLSTEPRWYRTHETFTENADLAANLMTTLVRTLQGTTKDAGVALNPGSRVALTMKHFPGGGPQELGLDPHYAFGKTQVYPGGNFAYHLKPFEAAIKAGVSSIMPYYGVPMNVTYQGKTFQQTGFAFSGEIVNWLLRDTLGFAGYVNSDTGIINDRAWGLETKTVPERVAAAINGGTDTLSGFHDVTTITDLVTSGLVSEARVDLAAVRLLTPLFQLGLFENPYVDSGAADTAVGSSANRETGLDLQRKSVVLLKNDRLGGKGEHRRHARKTNALPLAKGETLYMMGKFDKAVIEGYGYKVIDGNATPRPSAKGADRVVVSMTARNKNQAQYKSNDPATGLNPDHTSPIVFPGIKGLDGTSPWGAADACNAYGAPACTDDNLRFGGSFPWESSVLDFTGMSKAASWEVSPGLDAVQAAMSEIGDAKKVVLNIYFRQPYVLDDASGLKNAGAILANFGMSDTALMDVLTGKVAPQGRMPFALPKTRAAVEEQKSDLPGYAETEDGALYDYGYGLTYARKR